MKTIIDIHTGKTEKVEESHCKQGQDLQLDMMEVSNSDGSYMQLKEAEHGRYGFMTPTGKLQRKKYDCFRIKK